MKKNTLLIAILIFALLDLGIFAYLYKQRKTEPLPSETANAHLPPRSTADAPSSNGAPPMPQGLKLQSEAQIRTGHSAKSVLFDPSGARLYSLNLEEGSIYVFSRQSRSVESKLFFEHTPTVAYNYETRKWNEKSFEEKPVEGCFSHGGKFLWVSLHNAKGVVAWAVGGEPHFPKASRKAKMNGKAVGLHFMETGTTPKVIALHPSGKHLFVANWHSNTVSVLNIDGEDPALWHKVRDIPIAGTPRGMALSADGKKLYVGQMGAGAIVVVNAETFEAEGRVEIGPTPRHLIIRGDTLFASLSSPEQLVKAPLHSLAHPKWSKTLDDPRTIALSPDGQFIFVACYGANKLQVFRSADLKLLHTYSSPGSPVGVAVWQQNNQLEAWVVNYRYDTIKILAFVRA